MKKFIFVALITVLSACVGRIEWSHPNKNETEFYSDYSECEARAGQASIGLDDYGTTRQRVKYNCLVGKGYKAN
jgi:hypothetical protein